MYKSNDIHFSGKGKSILGDYLSQNDKEKFKSTKMELWFLILCLRNFKVIGY